MAITARSVIRCRMHCGKMFWMMSFAFVLCSRFSSARHRLFVWERALLDKHFCPAESRKEAVQVRSGAGCRWGLTAERGAKCSCQFARCSLFAGNVDGAVRSREMSLERVERGGMREGGGWGRGGTIQVAGAASSLHLVSPRWTSIEEKVGVDVIIRRMLRIKGRIDGGNEVRKNRNSTKWMMSNEYL